MKRAKLEKLLRQHGCQVAREGAKHTVWEDPVTGKASPVPRHTEIKRNTAQGILRRLGIDPDLATH